MLTNFRLQDIAEARRHEETIILQKATIADSVSVTSCQIQPLRYHYGALNRV